MIEENRQVYEFDEFRLDVAKRQLLREGEVVPLYSKAFDLLLLLVRSNGRDLSKDEILETIWPGQILEESNLTVNISAVRKALAEKAAQPRFLVTIPGRGYRFVAKVSEPIDAEGVLIATETISQITVEQEIEDSDDPIGGAAQKSLPAAKPAGLINSISQHKLGAGLAVIFLAIGIVGLVYYLRSRKTGGAIESIAVLPFTNAGGDPNSDYLSDGVTESIINSFSQLPHLRVIPRSAVFRYKGQPLDPQEIGKKLGVRAVLTGRVVQRGDSVNIQTELVDVDKNSQIWGHQYSLKLDELQSVQANISNQIMSELRLTLSDQERQRLNRHTPTPEAYQAYLKGRYFFNLDTEDGMQKAIASFNEAIKSDPNYALPYTGLATVYTQISGRSMSPDAAMAKAKDATLKALALDGSLADAHLVLARIHWWRDWDFPGAEQELKRALELNPNEPGTYMMYGTFLSCVLGRFDEAAVMAKRSLELDPLSLINHDDAAYLFYCARQPDRVIQEGNTLLELGNPASAHHWFGTGALLKGQYEQALREYQTATSISHRGISSIGFAYAVLGRRSEALKVIAELEVLSRTAYVSPYTLGFIYAGLGDKDHAFEWLEKAFAERNDNVPNMKTDPWLDNLRSDARFADLVRRVGLAP